MEPLVKMLIALFGSYVSCVCAQHLLFLVDGCSLSSPRFCSWMCDHRAFEVYGLQVSPCFHATGAPSLSRRILGMICPSFCGSPQRSSSLCSWRTCSFQLENYLLWCSLFWLACWQNFPVRRVDSGAFWAVCTTGFHLLSFCTVPSFWC